MAKGNNKLLKTITITVGVVAVCSMFACVGTILSFSRAPQEPQPLTGHIVPFNNHGTYLYITVQENLLYKGFLALGLVALFFGVAGGLWMKKRNL